MEPPTQFFISYNKTDRPWAEWVAWILEENGYGALIQEWDFSVGSNFVLQMDKAAASASRTIAILSPQYVEALYTQSEWASAFARDPTGETRSLVPVLVRKAELKGLLAQIVYVSLVDTDESTATKRLLAAVGGHRNKPSSKPTFPGGVFPQENRSPPFPRDWPDVWNVPCGPNPFFTGREDLLHDMWQQFQPEGAGVSRQAVFGLGGSGKTQLILEYVNRYASFYDTVWWIRSEEQDVMTADYVALSDRLLPAHERPNDARDSVDSLRRYLECSGGWLLVFDNAISPAVVGGYLPRTSSGHVLITSRNPTWDHLATVHRLGPLDAADSIRFLARRIGGNSPEHSHLAEELGHLPLALEQAAAYVKSCGITVADYLDLLRRHRTDLLSRESEGTYYEKPVSGAWDISMAAIESDFAPAINLLILCAFLGPEMSRAALAVLCKFLPAGPARTLSSPLALNDAVAALRRFSLVSASEDTLSFHRLVQTVVKSKIPNQEKYDWSIALRSIHSGIDDMLVSGTEEKSTLAPVGLTDTLTTELNKLREITRKEALELGWPITLDDYLSLDDPVLLYTATKDFNERKLNRSNPAACRMLGYGSEELSTFTLDGLCVPDSLRGFSGELRAFSEESAAVPERHVELITKGEAILSVKMVTHFVSSRGGPTFAAVFSDGGGVKSTQTLGAQGTRLKLSLSRVLRALVKSVEMRDPYTAGHARRVEGLTTAIAKGMGLPEELVEDVGMAASVHDLGKVSVPPEILSKPGRLSEAEFSILTEHPRIAYEILKEADLPCSITDVVLQHHERMDGSGYPDGLSGDAICVGARIVAVADVLEAMASHRPYRAALGIDIALKELQANVGTKYDADVVQACLSLFVKGEFDYGLD